MLLWGVMTLLDKAGFRERQITLGICPERQASEAEETLTPGAAASPSVSQQLLKGV